MTPRPKAPTPELPMDLVDAAGLLGAFGGLLSIGEPFFFGLTAALGALLVAAALLRRRTDLRLAEEPQRRRYYLIGFVVVIGAWAFVAANPPGSERYLGLLLGTAGLPLWWVARRPRPFGGD